jgi:hypothetical protein
VRSRGLSGRSEARRLDDMHEIEPTARASSQGEHSDGCVDGMGRSRSIDLVHPSGPTPGVPVVDSTTLDWIEASASEVSKGTGI